MATKTLDERENIIDRMEELYLMGARSAWQLYQKTTRSEVSNYDTCRRYLRVIERRLLHRWKNLDRQKILRRELQQLEMMEKNAWSAYEQATNASAQMDIFRTILKVKERRAKLLQLDGMTLNVTPSHTWQSIVLSMTEREPQAQT